MWDFDKIFADWLTTLHRLQDGRRNTLTTKDVDALRALHERDATLNPPGEMTDKQVQALSRAGAPERR